MSQSLVTIIAAVFVATAVTPAMANDFNVPKSDKSYVVADNSGLPTRLKGIGTYSGGISAKRFKGNGIYFYVDGNRRYGPPAEAAQKVQPRPGAKIIDVGEAQPAMDCNDSGDVCVIRP